MAPRKSQSKDAAVTSGVVNKPKQAEKTNTPQGTKRKRFDWTNAEFGGFALKPVKISKKRKSSGDVRATKKPGNQAVTGDADILQEDVFGAGLSATQFRVSPEPEWESTARYRRFTIDAAEFETGDTVFIKADSTQTTTKGAHVEDWVAKVLEVRAGDPHHVFLRVYWLYRPEDLPNGREAYHGANELIVSNDMDIIDAMTVNGEAKVIHWQEQKDKGEILNPEQLFWRQTLDVTKKPPRLSDLTRHCIDGVPHNPDRLLIQCDSCHKWLHGTCLEKAAVRDACDENDVKHLNDDVSTKGKKGKKRKSKGSVPFVAELSYNGTGEATHGRLTVIDRRSGPGKTTRWNVPIKCLLCDAVIEEASDNEAEQKEVLKAEEMEPKAEETADLKAEQKPEPVGETTDTAGSHLSINGGSDQPHTPANRGTEEDEDEEDPVIANDLSSPIKPSDPAAETSLLAIKDETPLLAIADAAAKVATNGVGAAVGEDAYPCAASAA